MSPLRSGLHLAALSVLALPLPSCTALLAGAAAVGSGYSAVKDLTNDVSAAVGVACQQRAIRHARAEERVKAGLVSAEGVAKQVDIAAYGDAACANPPPGDPLALAVWIAEVGAQEDAVTAP